MESFLTSDALVNPEYPGSILLSSRYSSSLKRRLAECITCYRAYEETGSTAMLYIAAWKDNDQRIWYEYVGRTFLTLFDCEPQEMSDAFRKSVKDRRIYKDLDPERGVQKEIKSSGQNEIKSSGQKEIGSSGQKEKLK